MSLPMLAPKTEAAKPDRLLAIGNPEEANRVASSELQRASQPQAARIAAWLSAPAPAEPLVAGLARIAAVCAKRLDDHKTADFTLRTYVNDLRSYPADVALAVISFWPDCSKFWPTWRELFDILETLMVERRAILAKARRAGGLEDRVESDYHGGEVGLLVRAAARKLGIGN